VAKAKTAFVCTDCGASALQWFGACPSCGAAGTLTETVTERGVRRLAADSTPIALSAIETQEAERIPSGLAELDRVLGGGLVAGQVVLIGGDPGIGKSTLLLQALAALGSSHKALYVSGEESADQVAMRARRLSLSAGGVELLSEIQLEKIVATLDARKPRVAVVDSIQTLWSDMLQSAPGSVAQVRECSAQLTRHAKRSGTALFIIGHVTKEGAIAGPRVLEHIVDTVLYFEGDPHSAFRLVRAVKNRFGAVNELGVFAMTDKGLRAVTNPSAFFLSRHGADVAGSCVLATLEGTRPLLVEIQALVDSAHAPNPRRLTVGLEQNRLAMLLAVLHRHAWRRHDGPGCVRQCSRRRADRRTGGRPRGFARGRIVADEPADSRKARRLRRNRSGRGGAARAARAGPAEGSGKAGFRARDHSQANAPKGKISGLEVTVVERIDEAVAELRNL
jgi:DNA repair protein RadA/Sms